MSERLYALLEWAIARLITFATTALNTIIILFAGILVITLLSFLQIGVVYFLRTIIPADELAKFGTLLGQSGDMFGGFNALASLVGVAMLVWGVRQQNEEIRLTRDARQKNQETVDSQLRCIQETNRNTLLQMILSSMELEKTLEKMEPIFDQHTEYREFVYHGRSHFRVCCVEHVKRQLSGELTSGAKDLANRDLGIVPGYEIEQFLMALWECDLHLSRLLHRLGPKFENGEATETASSTEIAVVLANTIQQAINVLRTNQSKLGRLKLSNAIKGLELLKVEYSKESFGFTSQEISNLLSAARRDLRNAAYQEAHSIYKIPVPTGSAFS